jgi:hypothetical protein
MHTVFRALSGPLLVVALAGCGDFLAVGNSNDPDRSRVLSDPEQLEARTADAFRAVHASTIGGNGGIAMLSRALSGEHENWPMGMDLFNRIPRAPIDNSRGNAAGIYNLTSFSGLSRAARTAADGLRAMAVRGYSLGSAARDARLKAFAWFTLGVAQGNLALSYDSAAVVDPRADPVDWPPLVGYRDGMAIALGYLDSALAWTNAAVVAAGANGFPLPSTWINGNALTAAQFTQLVRTTKARFRADVARTKTEGDAVAWQAVLDDAANGITADLVVTMQAAPWWNVFDCSCGEWAQAHQFYIGMADTSGGYDAWLQTPLALKAPFLVVTPDLRFPRGTTSAAQQANSPAVRAGVQLLCNRSRPPYPSAFASPYDNYRILTFAATPFPSGYSVLLHNQNDMLQAEALLRAGSIPAAAALIDLYRTRAGLPALSGVITALGQAVPGGTTANPVPGGASCVPRIPIAGATMAPWTRCGDIWEAMKWEFRMENMFVGYATWYFAARRWRDLPEGTALHWPVPWHEMDTRRQPFYDLGGVGGRDGQVGKGTYGL